MAEIDYGRRGSMAMNLVEYNDSGEVEVVGKAIRRTFPQEVISAAQVDVVPVVEVTEQ